MKIAMHVSESMITSILSFSGRLAQVLRWLPPLRPYAPMLDDLRNALVTIHRTKDPHMVYAIKLVLFICALQALKLTLFYVVREQWPEEVMLILVDYWRMILTDNQQEREMRFLLICPYVLAMTSLWTFYLNPHYHHLTERLVWPIVVTRSKAMFSGYFLSSHLNARNQPDELELVHLINYGKHRSMKTFDWTLEPDSLIPHRRRYRPRTVGEVIEQSTAWFVWFFQPFVFTAASLSLFYQLSYLKWYLKDPSRTNLYIWLAAQANIAMEQLAALMFAHSCLAVATFYVALTSIIFLRMGQIDGLLLKPVFNDRTFNRFRRLHTDTLLTVLQYDRVFGGQLSNMINLASPLTAYSILALVLGKVRGLISLLVGMICLGMLMAIGLFHYQTARYSKMIHRHSPRLVTLFVHSVITKQMMEGNGDGDGAKAIATTTNFRNHFDDPRMQRIFNRWNRIIYSGVIQRSTLTTRTRLRVAAYIDKFLTTNQYGITYGGNGLICTRAFAKNVIIFSRFAIFSYKLLVFTTRQRVD